METYRTEDEQLSAIKQFVGRHGTKLLAAVVVFIAAVLSYQSYQKNSLAEKNAASMLYAQINNQFSQQQQLNKQQQAAFDEQYALMLEKYPNTVYASYVSLLKAKFAVTEQELEQIKLDGLPASDLVLADIAETPLTTLFADCGLVKAGREVKDALGRNAVLINGEAKGAEDNMNTAQSFAAEKALFGRFFLVKLGKKKHHLFEIK